MQSITNKIDKNILLVNSEEDMIRSMSHFFQRRYKKCLSAHNSQEALELCSTTDIDILLADVAMPQGRGLELLSTVKKRHPHIYPIAIISGIATDAQLQSIMEMGISVFCKPLNLRMLQAHLYLGNNTQSASPLLSESVRLKMANRAGC